MDVTYSTVEKTLVHKSLLGVTSAYQNGSDT